MQSFPLTQGKPSRSRPITRHPEGTTAVQVLAITAVLRPRNFATIQSYESIVEAASMLDKSRVDKELARRLCAAFVSHRMGVSITTQYKKTPEEVGDLWYFLAALADKLVRESQDASYGDLGRLATEIIQ